jgi:hypothetical protein
MTIGGIEIEISLLKRKQKEILEFLSEAYKILALDDEITKRQKLWQLKKEVDKALSK